MKKIIMIVLAALMLLGCSNSKTQTDRMLSLRGAIQAGNGCSFDAVITADYGQQIYTFAMGCSFDAHGNLSFVVQQPERIAGICGTVDASGGQLRFDDLALAFPLLADGHANPVSSPWHLYKTLTGGMIKFAAVEDDTLHVTIYDSYQDDALQFDIWLNAADQPVRAELLYENRRILTLSTENFRIL
jgi:hypothetical protein